MRTTLRSTLHNNRIGERIPVSLPAKFQPASDSTSFLRRRPKPAAATITDLSVSGAEIESAAFSLRVRDKARIITADGSAMVEIRRIEPLGRNRVSYGVQFLSIDPGLSVRLNQIAVGGRGEEIDWRWSIAR